MALDPHSDDLNVCSFQLSCPLLNEVTLLSMDPIPKVLALDGSGSLIPILEDILLLTTMLPQVLIQHTLHTITQSIPYDPYENKYNIGTTCPQ